MFKTLKSKFITITLLLIIISVGIPSLFLINQFKLNFDERSALMIKSTLDIVVRSIYDRMMTDEHKDIRSIITDIANSPSVDHIRIIDRAGNIRYSSHPEEINNLIQDISPDHLIESGLDSIAFTKLTDEGLYSAIQPIFNTKECQKCHDEKDNLGYIDIDTQLTRAESYFYTGTLHIIFLAILIVIILFLIFYFVFEKLINKPLYKFVHAMDEVEQGNLSVTLPIENNDEIGMMERNFNKMVSKLRESKTQIEEMYFEQLRHADKLVTLGELAAEMAHEINNPAAIIMSRADYLNMAAEDNYQLESFKEDLDVIIKQIKRVSAITQNILKYSKKLPKEFDNIEIIQIINDSTKILEPRLKKQEIKLIKEFENNKVLIFGDAVQFEQLITNLVNNSIDAVDHNGEIKIRVNKIHGNKVQIIISDNGKGIDEHIREKIFTPFFTTKKGNKGTGLGLYIVKNICKNHNAEIECRSQTNHGTEFSITFKGVKGK